MNSQSLFDVPVWYLVVVTLGMAVVAETLRLVFC